MLHFANGQPPPPNSLKLPRSYRQKRQNELLKNSDDEAGNEDSVGGRRGPIGDGGGEVVELFGGGGATLLDFGGGGGGVVLDFFGEVVEEDNVVELEVWLEGWLDGRADREGGAGALGILVGTVEVTVTGGRVNVGVPVPGTSSSSKSMIKVNCLIWKGAPDEEELLELALELDTLLALELAGALDDGG